MTKLTFKIQYHYRPAKGDLEDDSEKRERMERCEAKRAFMAEEKVVFLNK
jgi:hypothetical protein